MDERNESGLEDRRQLEHLIPIGFAFLLPYVPYWTIIGLSLLSVVHALYLSPRWIRVTTRKDEASRGFSPGKLYYALSVLALLLLFRDRLYMAAAVWALLAVGDSLSNILGRRLGGPRLPYNPTKSVAGFVSFWVSGALASWALLLWNIPADLNYAPPSLLLFSVIASFLCALGESLPPVIDDNLAIAWIGAVSYPLLFSIPGTVVVLEAPWTQAIVLNAPAAILAWRLRWLSWSGALLALVFGTLIYCSMGIFGYLVIVCFLVLGSLSTQAGFAHKDRLKVAEAGGGQRSVASIVSNGLVPLALAILHFWLKDPMLRVAYTAALATAGFDTVSTEIGQWLGRRPVSPLTFRRVRVGTPGAISMPGTCAGILGALSIATLPVVLGWLPAQAIGLILGAALAGAFFESLLAAFFKYDFAFSDDALNLYNTLFAAVAAAVLWRFLNC